MRRLIVTIGMSVAIVAWSRAGFAGAPSPCADAGQPIEHPQAKLLLRVDFEQLAANSSGTFAVAVPQTHEVRVFNSADAGAPIATYAAFTDSLAVSETGIVAWLDRDTPTGPLDVLSLVKVGQGRPVRIKIPSLTVLANWTYFIGDRLFITEKNRGRLTRIDLGDNPVGTPERLRGDDQTRVTGALAHGGYFTVRQFSMSESNAALGTYFPILPLPPGQQGEVLDLRSPVKAWADTPATIAFATVGVPRPDQPQAVLLQLVSRTDGSQIASKAYPQATCRVTAIATDPGDASFLVGFEDGLVQVVSSRDLSLERQFQLPNAPGFGQAQTIVPLNDGSYLVGTPEGVVHVAAAP